MPELSLATKSKTEKAKKKAKDNKAKDTTKAAENPAGFVKGTDTKGTEIGKAREVGNTEMGPIERITAATTGPIERVNAEQIDKTQQEEFRRKQIEFANRLEAQTRGEGPSVASGEYRIAADRAMANQFALSRSGGGALAARQAAINAAGIQQEAARQASQIRMAEALAAQQQLGNVLETGRAGDINLATNQAGLNQGANLANAAAQNTNIYQNATLSQDAARANALAFNTQLAQQAQLNQNNALANAQAVNARNNAQAGINQQIQSSRIAAGASAAAAAAGAGASRYATDASLYKFNQQLGFDMDRYYQGNATADINANYDMGNAQINANQASRDREAAGYDNAGGAIAGSGKMPSSFYGG